MYAITYLGERFWYRVFEFLRNWYVKSAKTYANYIVNKLEEIDRHIAWKITLRHLFDPLFGDYTFIGRVISFPIRLIRLIMGGIFYVIFICVAASIFVVWSLIPIYLIWGMFFYQ